MLMSDIQYSTISVSGADAFDFLQAQLAADLAQLPETGLAAWCNPKGRVIALFHLRREDGTFRLALPAALAEAEEWVGALSAGGGTQMMAPPGLRVVSHSLLRRFDRYSVVHWVGAWVQAPSRPLVTASRPTPRAVLFNQPKPWSSSGAPSGSGPSSAGSPLPCALPTV